MAIKKSELYRSIWESCDQLRGSMDASMYKDYVLVLLFIKYVSDKYAGQLYGQITVPEGAGFGDMVRMKGKDDIGDRINKEVIEPLFSANGIPRNQAADFNDDSKLGTGKDKVDRLTNLIAIFENPNLDFSDNGAAGDDILGDAYEYLMRHFATESGKSKGQFYTPAEVSRVLAKVLEMQPEELGANTTVFDPACGSGSLLLKVADEANRQLSIYGQENDVATSTLARMNVVLHDMPGALQEIKNGNTLASPKHLDNGRLKQFDFVVANPPFSYKSWTNGVNPENDPYERFQNIGVPPDKNGDYTWVLHILKSLKATGRAAVILPHGVLFRGNAEAGIRQALLERGLLSGIIGLPANLFYGTGIPACILLLDKAEAKSRKHVFMIDASRGFIKDGNKNRLRERDIHRIVDVFTQRREDAGYSRNVSLEEIADNDHNLNLPRYLDGRAEVDVQDIDGHLNGGIPTRDLEALENYWTVLPCLRSELCEEIRPGYYRLTVARQEMREHILGHPEFISFHQRMQHIFAEWRDHWRSRLKALEPGFQPKNLIGEMSESLLAAYRGKALVDPYAVYQHLLDYWNDTLQDDLYLISTDGWAPGREAYRLTKTTKTKKGSKKTDIKGIEGIESRLLPPRYLIDRFFTEEQSELDRLRSEAETAKAAQDELAEEHGGDEQAFGELDSISKTNVSKLYKATKNDPGLKAETAVLQQYLEANARESQAKKAVKKVEATIEEQLWLTYEGLDDEQLKSLVVDDKWLGHLETAVAAEVDRSSQQLATRLGELADRYTVPLKTMVEESRELESKVYAHLEKMGYQWQ